MSDLIIMFLLGLLGGVIGARTSEWLIRCKESKTKLQLPSARTSSGGYRWRTR